MNDHAEKRWARGIAHMTVKHPWWVLLAVIVVTVISLALSETLELKLNFTDLLPEKNEVALNYRHMMNRWAEPSITIVLEGDREQMARMATELDSLLEERDDIYNVQAKLPQDHFIDHGFTLLKPDEFDRMTKVFDDPKLLGVFSRFNDDYEREYTDSEDNLKDDELIVARSLQGVWRSLEVLDANLNSNADAPPIADAATSLAGGEPWMLSLDRKMMILMVYPTANSMRETDKLLVTTADVEALVNGVAERYPEVHAGLTGMGPIGKAEMESVGPYTYVLMLVALILIYLLLARSSHGWVLPLLQLTPLLAGIFWTMGLLALLVGTLNYFTVMMGLVLMGLGIDFTIHLVSRYGNERGAGVDLETALTRMLGGTGSGVLTGGLTTAAAFFTLMIADTKGVSQFGLAAGSGVLLTLAAVFIILPTLLVLHDKAHQRRKGTPTFSTGQREGWPLVGNVTLVVWKRPAIVLPIFLLLVAGAVWAAMEIDFEYDFMQLEPHHAPSVILQQTIPKRFGISDQAGWAVHSDIDSARADAEKLKDLGAVGAVEAISDYIPDPKNIDAYRGDLLLLRSKLEGWQVRTPQVTPEEMTEQINRLWDNLDLMSNLAFQAGLDRIVTVIDGMTGYMAESDSYDSTAVLPHLIATLESERGAANLASVAGGFEQEMKGVLIRMTNDSPVQVADLPASVRKSFLPTDGNEQYRMTISPREYAWSREASDRFIEQTETVTPDIISTPYLFIVMTVETLRDGRNGSLLALAVIILLLFIHFRSPTGLLAILPLLGSAVFMIGAMYLVGMKYNYMNLIALPIILGIGIDDGVHALHRWREEKGSSGERVHEAFSHVGRAILLTSLTTMIGFGSIGLYEHPGMASFGIVLFMGVGFCFISTVLVLPAVMRVLLRDKPRGEEIAK